MTTLCLLLTLSSGLARPVSVNGGRQLLQAGTSSSAASTLQNLAASGASQADLAAAFSNLLKTTAPADAANALNLALQAAKNSGATNNLAGAISDTAKSQPGSATSIGTVLAGATASSDPNAVTGAAANSSAVLSVINSGGITQATITAIGSAQGVAVNAISSSVATAISTVEGGGPVTAAATACAQAIGTAAAIAITNVTAKGTVKGSGSAVGSGSSNAGAFAQAFSLALSKAFALAKNGATQAVAIVESTATTSALATAVSKAEASINLQGPGTQSTSVMSIAVSIQQAISLAIAQALAAVGPSTSG